MDRQEYQRRRRALEELYQTDLRLLRAAHEARIRSLEALWLDLERDGELPAASAILLPAAAEARVASLSPAPELSEPVEVTARNPDLRTALEEILPALPTVFEKKDVVQALGWTPSRSSLHRVLSDMAAAGLLEFQNYSGGRTPTQYRKA